MFAGISHQSRLTLIFIGLFVVTNDAVDKRKPRTESLVRQRVSSERYEDIKRKFLETRDTVRKSLMHAYQGSIRLLEDGTIEWCKQENKHKFDSDELITAYMSAMDIICEDQIDSMLVDMSQRKTQALLTIGLLVTTDTRARQREYQGEDIAWEKVPHGFHNSMRKHFREARAKIRNSLMHSEPGSIRVLRDGSVEWFKQKKKQTIEYDKLCNAYTYGMLADSEIVPGSIRLEGNERATKPSEINILRKSDKAKR